MGGVVVVLASQTFSIGRSAMFESILPPPPPPDCRLYPGKRWEEFGRTAGSVGGGHALYYGWAMRARHAHLMPLTVADGRRTCQRWTFFRRRPAGWRSASRCRGKCRRFFRVQNRYAWERKLSPNSLQKITQSSRTERNLFKCVHPVSHQSTAKSPFVHPGR